MTARIRVIDERHFDELFARRVELLTEPATANQPATTGHVVFHTVWLHYRDGVMFAESAGPRLQHTFDTIMGRTWMVPDGDGDFIPLPTMLIMGGLKTAFDTIANETLSPPVPSMPEPEPDS